MPKGRGNVKLKPTESLKPGFHYIIIVAGRLGPTRIILLIIHTMSLSPSFIINYVSIKVSQSLSLRYLMQTYIHIRILSTCKY